MTKKLNEKFNQLSSIVKGEKPSVADPASELSNYWIKRSEEVLKKTKNLDTIERNMVWRRETEGWAGWEGNREYRAEIEDTLSPLSNEEAKRERIKGVSELLIGMDDESRDYWFKDNAHKQPKYVLEHLEPMFDNTSGKLDGKAIERNRINQTLEISNLLMEKDLFGLNPDVAVESHVESIRQALINGYTEFTVDNQGFVSVPADGGTRAINLPDSNNVTDSLISQIDWVEPINKVVSNVMTGIRKTVVDTERDTLKELRFNITNPNIKPEHRKSILADYALNISKDPVIDVNLGIQEILSSDIDNKKYKSSTELAHALIQLHDEVWNTLIERI